MKVLCVIFSIIYTLMLCGACYLIVISPLKIDVHPIAEIWIKALCLMLVVTLNGYGIYCLKDLCPSKESEK